MPIEFQPAQPFDAAPAQQAAANDTYLHFLPTLAQGYADLGRRQDQQQQFATQARLQSNAQAGELAQRDAALRLQVGAQADARAAEGAVSARDVFHAEQQQAGQRQAAENAAWLSQQQVTQAEQLEMRRAESSVAFWQQKYAAGDATREELNDQVALARTRIDPVRQRLERQQVEHSKKQDEMLVQKMSSDAAHQAAWQKTVLDLAEKGVNVRMLPDGKGGWHGPFGVNAKTGEIYKIGVEHPDEGGAGGKAGQADAKLTQAAVADYGKKLQQAVVNTQNYVNAVAKANPGKPAPDWDTVLAKSQQELGVRVPPEQYVRQYRGLHGKPAGGGGDVGGGGDWSGGDQPPGGGGQQPPPRRSPEEAKKADPPFDFGDLSKVTPRQADSVDVLQQYAKIAMGRPDLSRDQRALYYRQAQFALHELARYGSADGMPEAARQHFDLIRESLKYLERPPAQAPRPAAPPGPLGGFAGGAPLSS